MEASENPASQSAPSGGMARLFLLLQASLRPVEGILIRMISCLTAASTTWRSTPLAGFLLTHMGHFSSPFQELARNATQGDRQARRRLLSQDVLWKPGTQAIVLRSKKGVLAERRVSQHSRGFALPAH